MMLNTPILLITFNRPDHTRQTLRRILEAQPRDLYIFQDGARSGNANDALKCQQVRDVINEQVAEYKAKHSSSLLTLHSYFSEANLGCGAGPMTGISWFFENVEQGIVMEDDCLAHPDFFPYCEELLNRYKGTEVKFINSTLYDDRWNQAFNEERLTKKDSYGFSRYMVTGAWASYREFWKGFDLDLKSFDCKAFRKIVLNITGSWDEANWWYFKALEMRRDNSKKSYWDYQCSVHLFMQNAITIHPRVNLVSNIGFDPEGTHTLGNDGRGNLPNYPIMPLVHPQSVRVDKKIDFYCFSKIGKRSIMEQWISYVYNTMYYDKGLLHSMLLLYKRLKGK